MAKIALRAYNREIETLVERGQIEEAIAHSKYILRFFPKHVETYRLLGKAYIESQRYSEAADVLQRILSVIPDDFVSQIGMSIIREDEGNLDAAIFHMERAHEIQPSNVAVQDELRRLYGRRDGVEPPRLRLTRGALVRLYAKGDLYRQAIAEIRAALAEDPSRYDLEVILARMYFMIDQKVEATDISSRLVSRLPYCLEANRILADVLPTTSRADDAKTYQQRVYALDPYLAYISTNAPTAALVPDNAVTLDRLDWHPSASGEAEPAWAQDVGITLGEEKEAEAAPDWLTTPSEPEPEAKVQPSSDQSSLPATYSQVEEAPKPAEAAQIPDWMQASGWIEAGQTAQEAAGTEENLEEAAPGELPDWLKEMAPQDAGAQSSSSDETKLDWLDDILPPVAEASPTVAPEVEMPSESSVAASIISPAGSEISAETPANSEDALPDWMTFSSEEPQAAPEALAETPETILPQAASAESNADQAESAFEPGLIEPAAEVPAEGSVSEALLADTPVVSPEQLLGSQDETPIAGFSMEEPAAQVPVEQAAAPDEVISVPPEVEAPVSQVAEEPVMKIAETETDQTPVAQVEESQPEEKLAAQEQPVIDDLDAAMAWLESLAAKQGADQETLSTPIDQQSETPPEWVTREMDQAQAEPTAAEPEPTAELPVTASEIVAETPAEPDQKQIAEIQFAPPEAELTGPALEKEEDSAVESSLPQAGPAEPAGSAPSNNLVARFAGLDSETTQSIPQDAFANSSLYPFKEFSSLKPAEPADDVEFTPPENLAPPVEDQYTRAEKKTSPLGQAAQPTSQEEMDADAAFAWLESLAAQQGADEGTLSTPPEDRLSSAPSWVLEQPTESTELTDASDLLQGSITLEAPVDRAPAQPSTPQPEITPLSEWQQSTESPLASLPEEPTDVAPPAEPVEWVEEAAEARWTPETTVSSVPDQPESVEESKSEEPLPAWLQGYDQNPVEAPEETKPAAVEDLPDWLKDFDTPAEASLTQASDESISISSWLKDQVVDEDQQPPAAPVTVEDTQPVKVIPVQPVAASEPRSAAPEPIESAEVEKPKADVHPGAENPFLAQAQAAMQDGKIDQALNIYNHLIEEGQLLDEVVHDLRDPLYRYPVEISIWQTLGDAYIRSNHIQEALDAYTKAEELLK